MAVIVPPERPEITDFRGTVFLAGAIDNGAAEPWQDRLIEDLSDTGATFLNPRRPDWDTCLRPAADVPEFVAQVEWETYYLARAEVVVFYFPAGTIAPITLLELGEFGRAANAAVYAPAGYHRAGNVQLFARRRGIACFTDRHEFVENLRRSLQESHRERERLGASLAAATAARAAGGGSSSPRP